VPRKTDNRQLDSEAELVACTAPLVHPFAVGVIQERAADARGAIQIKTYQQVIFMMSNPGPAATLPIWGACCSSGDTIGWLRLNPRLEHAFGALGGSVGQSRKNAQAKGVVIDWTAGYGPWTAEHDGMWLDLISSLT
jgi:hypothetical protein